MAVSPPARRWSHWRHVDVVLALVTVAIAAVGCLMLYTSTRAQLEANGLPPTFYAKKQLIFMAIGVVVMLVVAAIDYRKYRDRAWFVFGLTVLALLAVYVIGHKSRGAQAWFQIGSYQIEPSEYAKPALILAMASFVGTFKGRMPLRALMAALGLAAVPLLLIYKQPDLGTALVLAVVLIAVLSVGGVRARHLGVLVVLAAMGTFGILHFGVLKQYQRDRLISFLSAPNHPSAQFLASQQGATYYNDEMSRLAVSDGGLKGKGLGKGLVTNLGDVPEQQTDFIFSAIAEQVGLIGSVVLLALFLLMVWRTWRVARLARDLT
ncbi:MAG TPA: FtsW/RodA/SpoVE family cell cycle protein, partial [Acidimicrobiales bacterium]|nr:FtsW/RodA/SpoVE family cell cycle protein [Acidimicrobiales bacterium]